MTTLSELFDLIAAGDRTGAEQALAPAPALVAAGLARADEHFLEARRAQVYAGDTALHAASFSHDAHFARVVLALGADVRARNRRGAEPLHSAMTGGPGSAPWVPSRQLEVIVCLVEAGADLDARSMGGVTPLHRAVRNRCSGAVEVLLRLGADPRLRNDSGSSAADLAQWTTGRGGTGTETAKAEQQVIIELLRDVV
jgi:ankyrin repeat protein